MKDLWGNFQMGKTTVLGLGMPSSLLSNYRANENWRSGSREPAVSQEEFRCPKMAHIRSGNMVLSNRVRVELKEWSGN